MWSPTLTAVLFSVLVGQQLFFASGNGNAADPDKKSASICEPQPTAEFVGNRSTCPFTMKVDIKIDRIPKKIYHFNCNCPGRRCSDHDDYRCLQVKVPMQVSVAGWNAKRKLTFLDVNTSCVCAASKSKRPDTTVRILDDKDKRKVSKRVNGTTIIDVDETPDQL